MKSYDVDAIVAVHDPARPVERCVRSIDEGTSSSVRLRISVVCHNIDVEEIRAVFSGPVPERVRFLELRDGIRSPAGPFNAGIDAADAEYVSTVGSDDLLEPGALDAWWAVASRTGADAVLAPIRTDDGLVQTPLLRPRGPSPLDPLHDRLVERTAPLGLLRTRTLDRIGYRYTEGGLGNGEDIEPALRLWFLGRRIEYPYGAPAYRVTDAMGSARQTAVIGPLARELAFLPLLLEQSWVRALPSAHLDAVLVKVLRRQAIAAIRRRAGLPPVHVDAFSEADAAFLRGELARIERVRGRMPRGLSIAEARILSVASSGDARSLRELLSLLSRPRLAKIIARRPLESLASEGPIRQQLRTLALARRSPIRDQGPG
ncbi:hypothetical protein [Brachybacterium hainanense]|uniref:Glycosyltransferase 2-like domain-containing protein n=1 Tax=Brachybacterium hainanense TaxID=1541174 RepID=A0ABV6RDH6_9MICO